METLRKRHSATISLHKPKGYTELSKFINELPAREWRKLLGAYASEGWKGVNESLRASFPVQLSGWSEYSLGMYLSYKGRKITSFNGTGLRSAS